MKIKIKHKNKTLSLDTKEASKFSTGLMFKTKKTKPLVFSFDKPSNFKITSLFVFFPFIAVWLDKKNKVIESRKIEPFRLSVEPNKKFSKLIEIPINEKNKKIIKTLVGN